MKGMGKSLIPDSTFQIPESTLPLVFGLWALDFPLRFHQLTTVVNEFMNGFFAFQTDKATQAGFPDVVTAHVHVVITTVEQLAALSLLTKWAHKNIFRQSSLPGRQQGYFETMRDITIYLTPSSRMD